MESLCRSLSELADSLRAKSEGAEGGPEVPGSLDAALGAARTALQSEVAALRAPAKKKTGKQGGRADKETLNEEINNKLFDHIMGGIESVSGKFGHYYIGVRSLSDFFFNCFVEHSR